MLYLMFLALSTAFWASDALADGDPDIWETWSSAPCTAEFNEEAATRMKANGKTVNISASCAISPPNGQKFIKRMTKLVVDQHTCNSGFANTGEIVYQFKDEHLVEINLNARTQRYDEIVHCVSTAHIEALLRRIED